MMHSMAAPKWAIAAGTTVFTGLLGLLIVRGKRLRSTIPRDRKHALVKLQPVPDKDDTGAAVHVVLSTDGIQLYVRCWAPAAAPFRACLVMVHGYSFHSRYFQETAGFLTAAGYAVVTFDLAAHGLSGSSAGIQGYYTSVDGFVGQVEAVLRYAHQLHPGAKMFLYGESFGGVLAALAAMRPHVTPTLSGLITAGAPVGLPEVAPPRPVLALIMALSKIMPQAVIPNDPGTSEKGFISAFSDTDWARNMYRTDDLVVKETRLGVVGAILPGVMCIQRCLPQLSCPLLVLHGGADARVAMTSAALMYHHAGSADKQLRVYSGLGHQLLQEQPQNRQPVWDDMLAWLNQHSSV